MTRQKEIQLKINNEYLEKIPRPEVNQYEALKESIKEKGQLEPIIINEDFEIIDGYTRFQICKELSLDPKFEIRRFSTKKDESLYVRTVNQKRRHLNPLQLYEIYEEEIQEIKKFNIQSSNQKKWDVRKGKLKKNDSKMKYENSTMYKTMKLTGLSKGQIEGINYLKRNADEEIIDKVRTGQKQLFSIVNKMKAKELRAHKQKEYRSGIKIMIDVLNTINENDGCIISVIGRKANLSHYTTIAHTEPLIKMGYLVEEIDKNTRKLRITETGTSLLKKCNDLLELLPKRLRVR